MRPQVDLTPVLTNPFLLDQFDVWRRKQSVSPLGVVSPEIIVIPAVVGVVFAEGPSGLTRKPEARTAAKTLIVFTRFNLRSESQKINGDNWMPDVLYWNAGQYLVIALDDFSHYALGWVKATVASKHVVDRPPEPFPPRPINEALEQADPANLSYGFTE